MLACRNGSSWRTKFKLNLTYTSPQVIQSCKILACMPDDFVNDYILAALAQMEACLPLVQRIRGSIPGGVVNFHLKLFNLGARRGGDVHFLIARLYITGLD